MTFVQPQTDTKDEVYLLLCILDNIQNLPETYVFLIRFHVLRPLITAKKKEVFLS